MNSLEESLKAIDEFFATATEEQVREIDRKAAKLNDGGVNIDEYLDSFGNVTPKSRSFYVCLSVAYGGGLRGLKREYDTVEEFDEDVSKMPYGEYRSIEPLLVRVTLRDDEEYYITDYDGSETISFRKRQPILSRYEEVTFPWVSPAIVRRMREEKRNGWK